MTLEELYNKYLECTAVSTDTRTIKPGNLFVGLKGPTFDGNKYAAKALASGARYAIVDDAAIAEMGGNYLLVEDCLLTLQQLARHHSAQLDCEIIGLTGSNGKTTTKELLLAVLSTKFNVAATMGNYNNHIGVPLTILNASKDSDLLIVEMGTNQPGDIKALCDIADPDLGLITNIGASHLEKLISLEGVLNEKAALFHYISRKEGHFFLNIGDDHLKTLEVPGDFVHTYDMAQGPFGSLLATDSQDGLRLDLIWSYGLGVYPMHTQLSGSYNAENIAAVLSVAVHYDLAPGAIVAAIESYHPDNMRSQVVRTDHNMLVVDAYNANPTSMRASIISFLKNRDGQPLLILGDMLELGSETGASHREIVDLLRAMDVQDALLVGQIFSGIDQDVYPTYLTTKSLVASGALSLVRDKMIMIKASRGVGLEAVIAHL